MAMQAQDTMISELEDGTVRFVAKGEVLPDSHELVRRDVDAQKANPARTPLFRKLDLGEEEDERAASRAQAQKGTTGEGSHRPAEAPKAKARGRA